MGILLAENDPAIVRGIKTVGVGKKGSKPLTVDLAQEILRDLQSGNAAEPAVGAFFAGLLAKGLEPQEQELCQAFMGARPFSPQKLITVITGDSPVWIQDLCQRLYEGETLDTATAYRLGQFLLAMPSHGRDALPGERARGFVASFLRVRYETADEYQGIWQAMQETLEPSFRGVSHINRVPLIQLAEPFDGTDHSMMITPLVANDLIAQGYKVMHVVGRNSGPKLVFNLLDVAEQLQARFVQNAQELNGPPPRFGWFVRQSDCSKALDRWVDVRRATIKRPFLATLEKFIKPVPASIIVTSAFHPPYGEKMLTISERCGFPGAMVIRNGIEGSMAFPLKRPAKILLSARRADGRYLRHEMTFEPESVLDRIPEVEETRENLDAAANAKLIEEYVRHGKTQDPWFDLRVQVTCAGFRLGLNWLREHLEGKE